MPPLFVLIRDAVVLREIPFVRDRLTIGRSPINDLRIDDPAISATHAEIVRADDELILRDLNSTNGTKVSGQPVHRHYLRDGDIIGLANFELLCRVDCVLSPDQTAIGRLLVVDGPHQGRALAVGARPVTIGDRGAQGIVCVDAAGVARLVLGGVAGSTAEAGKELAEGEFFSIGGTCFQFLRY